MRAWGGRRLFAVVAGVVAVALPGPAGAGAATVVNGDFEAGDLRGWQVRQETESGDWFAYEGNSEPIAMKRGRQLPQAPPQGRFAAISDQLLPESLILSQSVDLAAGRDHRLSLLAYYDSAQPLTAPPTLSVAEDRLGGQPNQQFRVDVLRAGAPLDSLEPADVLATAFRTGAGGPLSMAPTWVTANLSPFAGQTVTLRVASVATQELLNAGIDAVSVDSTAPGVQPPPLGSSRFSFGKLKLNRAKGTAILAVEVPAPGRLTAKGRGIKRAVAKPPRAGIARLRLKPNSGGLRTLRGKHKLRVRVAVTFVPTGGEARTKSRSVTLKLAAPRHRP